MIKNLIFTLITIFIMFSSLELLLVVTYIIGPKINLPTPILALTKKYYYLHDRKLDQYHCGRYDESLFYKYEEGNCTVENLEFATNLSINSFGVRDTEESLNSDLNIVFIGDSHTQGWGMSTESRFSGIIAKQKGLNTINLGISSYGTVREMRNLELLNKINSSFEYVVLQYEGNDIDENKSYFEKKNKIKISSEKKFAQIKSHNVSKSKYFPGSGILFLYETAKENFKILVNKKFNIHFEYMPHVPKKTKRTDFEIEQEINYMVNAVKQKSDILLNKKLIIIGIATSRTTLHSWEELLKKELKRQGISSVIAVIDMEKILNKNDFFVFDRHINETGHRKVATEILKYIKD